MDGLIDFFALVQQWLFEAAVQPAMFALGLGNLLEDGYEEIGRASCRERV